MASNRELETRIERYELCVSKLVSRMNGLEEECESVRIHNRERLASLTARVAKLEEALAEKKADDCPRCRVGTCEIDDPVVCPVCGDVDTRNTRTVAFLWGGGK